MTTERPSYESHREPTGRFPLALFIVAELLCTGALIAWLVL